LSFVQPAFPLFVAIVLAVYWSLGRTRWQNFLLLLSSAVFYGWVHPWFLGLLAFSIALDFGCGLAMGQWPEDKTRFLVLSVSGNLGLLGVFKYYDFFASNFASALGALGLMPWPPTLGLLLPVGISFFTFQTLSYTIDVYRGRIEPCRDWVSYATYVSFFPQLVAGPIERADALLPQVAAPRIWNGTQFVDGLGLALWGAVKKVVVADTLALSVDHAFALENPSGAQVWVATLAFAFQIFADFSGYTDIARGTAQMLGFELRENFRAPFAATNPTDFWRRWHISLTTWLHDYLYLPLRTRLPATTAGAVTLVLAGLWHGASWNFVLWGVWFAAVTLAYRLLQPWKPSWSDSAPGRGLAIALMFSQVLVGMLIFRIQDFDRLLELLVRPPWAGGPQELVLAGLQLSLAIAGGLVLWLGGYLRHHVLPAAAQRPWRLPARTTLWATAIVVITVFARDTGRDFIYFQF
jgi:D-alanyl-lipoteichoic acid acyltransferase DltB (MBOAT superfamily)